MPEEFTNEELNEMGLLVDTCPCENVYEETDDRGEVWVVCIDCGVGTPVMETVGV